MLVLFGEGDFGVWDVGHGVRVSTGSYLKSRGIRALDLDWLTPTNPVVGMVVLLLRLHYSSFFLYE